MNALFWLIDTVIDLYILAIIVGAVLSWLIAFGIVNTHNQFVSIVGDFLNKMSSYYFWNLSTVEKRDLHTIRS